MPEYTQDQWRRALELACEGLLRGSGDTDAGVEKHLPQQVQMYLDMATGKREVFMGFGQFSSIR